MCLQICIGRYPMADPLPHKLCKTCLGGAFFPQIVIMVVYIEFTISILGLLNYILPSKEVSNGVKDPSDTSEDNTLSKSPSGVKSSDNLVGRADQGSVDRADGLASTRIASNGESSELLNSVEDRVENSYKLASNVNARKAALHMAKLGGSVALNGSPNLVITGETVEGQRSLGHSGGSNSSRSRSNGGGSSRSGSSEGGGGESSSREERKLHRCGC
uniref:ARAD1A01320p n=1 Tax=Blastobotrys adeninivorans TaxID=409370 RepID=A0A060SVZ7_BLAAD